MDAMIWISIVVLQIALVFGMVVIFLIYRRMTRDGVSILKEKINKLESELVQVTRSRIDEHHKRLSQITENIEKLEIKGKRNTELFSTVLHGFDFIVQGCKKALTTGETEQTDLPLDTTESAIKGVSGNSESKEEKPLYESISLEEEQS